MGWYQRRVHGGKKKKKKKKKKNGSRSPADSCSNLRPPPHHCVRIGARTPPLARSLHRCRPLIPRRVPRRRLWVGHLRTLNDTGSSRSQPRTRAHPCSLGHGRVTRGSPPRAALGLRGYTSRGTSLVQGRCPDLLVWRAGLPR